MADQTKPEPPTIYVSPAEPRWLKDKLEGRFTCVYSPKITEGRGVDIAWRADGKWWGAQRKAIDDLIASLGDRLTREVSQMTADGGVHMPHIIVEGSVRFTSDGMLIRDGWGQQMTRRQWRGLIWSVQQAGVSVSYATTRGDTAEIICDLYEWSQKARHSTLRSRVAAPKGEWGTRGNREWSRWILQGFDGVGPEVADAIVDKHGLPLTWTVGVDELLQVPGVGKVRAEKLLRALGPQLPRVDGTVT